MTPPGRKHRKHTGETLAQAARRIAREVAEGVRCKRCTLTNPCHCFDPEEYARARKDVSNGH